MRILLQTALNLEFNAMKAYLTDVEPVTHPTTGSKYEKGLFSSKGITSEVILIETGAGNVRSADETGRSIEFFKPDYTFFVGVAGGLKDVNLGDVVASSKVMGYEMGKDDDEFKPRIDTLPSAYDLEQLAKQVKRNNKWNEYMEDKVTAYVEPIAAGEKVVASENAVAYKYLRKFCSDALAVAMEGNGFMVAARAHNVKAIEIRGISDMISDKETADASGSQPKAAENAAAFTFAMIELLLQDKKAKTDISDPEVSKLFLKRILELYPQGPEQDNIWKRAGGDVSILINSSSRYSQWFNAVNSLKLGGGGKNITVASLIDEIKNDYPNRTDESFFV